MASTIKVDKLDPQSGTALEIGTSGDTITVPTGAGLTVVDEVKTNKISPATGTAFALGDSGDTFTVPSGATIVNSGTATGFGKILQVVQGSSSYEFTTTSASFVDVEQSSGVVWETAITPSATSSKIFVSFNPVVTMLQIGAQAVRGTIKVLEKIGAGSYANLSAGTVLLETMVGGYDYGSSGLQVRLRPVWEFLSSTNTTDECKYKIQVSCSGGTTAYVNSVELGTVILWEVGA